MAVNCGPGARSRPSSTARACASPWSAAASTTSSPCACSTACLGGAAAVGVADDDVVVEWVPGAFEIPFAAKVMASSGRFDAVICLGAVIRGDTGHYDFVAGECAGGIQDVQLDTGVPVMFGVLTAENSSRPGLVRRWSPATRSATTRAPRQQRRRWP